MSSESEKRESEKAYRRSMNNFERWRDPAGWKRQQYIRIREKWNPEARESSLCKCCGRIVNPTIGFGSKDCTDYEMPIRWHCSPSCFRTLRNLDLPWEMVKTWFENLSKRSAEPEHAELLKQFTEVCTSPTADAWNQWQKYHPVAVVPVWGRDCYK